MVFRLESHFGHVFCGTVHVFDFLTAVFKLKIPTYFSFKKLRF